MDEVFDLAKFDEYREDNRLEVKRAKDRLPNALWETYSSFANTAGGCIILGVKERDDRSWYTTGLKDAEKLRKEFFDSLHNQNKVNIALVSDDDVVSYEVDGDVILVIKVPKARREEKPIYIDNDMWNGTYRRDGEGDYHCSREAVLAMLRDQTEDSPDMRVLEDMNTIHHIAIICSGKEAAIHFYHDLLGFPIIRENYRPERDDWKIDLRINDATELELFIMKDRPARVSNPEAYGLRHLAFRVESVDEMVAELEGKGISCEPVRTDTFTGEKMTFFHDPDGLPIEIHE